MVTYYVHLAIKARPKERPMPQLRLVYSQDATNASANSKLRSIKPKMLRKNLSSLPPLAAKVMKLARAQPEIAAVIERMVDDFLLEGGQ